MDMMGEECGVVGIYIHPNDKELFDEVSRVRGFNGGNAASSLTYLILRDLQHRGQESAGIASYGDELGFSNVKKMGQVDEIFDSIELAKLKGNYAIGHTRYSTISSSSSKNAQPLCIDVDGWGRTYIAHNGNFSNADIYLDKFSDSLITSIDTEVALHLLNETDSNFSNADRLKEAYSQIEGANTSLLLNEQGLFAFRDAKGYRPLVKVRINDSYILASEDGGLERYILPHLRKKGGVTIEKDELKPGTYMQINGGGVVGFEQILKSDVLRQCSFEPIYIARPDATIFNMVVSLFKIEIGKKMYQEQVDAGTVPDIEFIVPVLDSGMLYASGYSIASGIPLLPATIRDHHFGRSFNLPLQESRIRTARLKQIQLTPLIENRRIGRIDDSEVRGTTAEAISEMDRRSKVKDTHWMFAYPTIEHPCYWGTDFPTRDELISAQMTIDEIIHKLGDPVKSIQHLSLDGLKDVIDMFADSNDFCYHCITGEE